MTDRDKNDIVGGVGRLWLLFKRHGRRIFSDLNLGFTFEQAMVLFILNAEEGLTIGRIAEQTDRDRTTTSRMINGLEAKNLVVRVPGRDDNRQKRIYLTRLAKEVLERLNHLKVDFDKSLLEGIDPADIIKATEVLYKMADNIEKE
ncbi:MAG: MarR family transcriptional regulator [candidate division Zixibacteria bacterium]|jgi:DNA-binding MarR family transcriptional regulator|nr:MarR family transcriptional regulator [candidate division Zixibacteria bacterium]